MKVNFRIHAGLGALMTKMEEDLLKGGISTSTRSIAPKWEDMPPLTAEQLREECERFEREFRLHRKSHPIDDRLTWPFRCYADYPETDMFCDNVNEVHHCGPSHIRKLERKGLRFRLLEIFSEGIGAYEMILEPPMCHYALPLDRDQLPPFPADVVQRWMRAKRLTNQCQSLPLVSMVKQTAFLNEFVK